MQRNELHDLILGTNGRPAGKSNGSVKSLPLTILVDGEEPYRIVLHFQSANRDWINLLVTDEKGEICVQKERRCKVGFNTFRLNLEHLPSGHYRIDLLSPDRIESGQIDL